MVGLVKEIHLKLEEVNTGFCRVLYSTRNEQGKKIFYSLQDDWPHWQKKPLNMYRNTQPPCWCEPEYVVKFREDIKIVFDDIPRGDSKLEEKVREFIEGVNYETCNKSN